MTHPYNKIKKIFIGGGKKVIIYLPLIANIIKIKSKYFLFLDMRKYFHDIIKRSYVLNILKNFIKESIQTKV